MYEAAIVMAVVLVLIALKREGFTAEAQPLVYHGWRYDPRVNPVTAEIARVADGAISAARCGAHGGAGSRDFSRHRTPYDVDHRAVPYMLADPTDSVMSEQMCGGRDSMCTCSGNATK